MASIRAPRTTIASSVSPILCNDTLPIACSASGLVRSTCGFISAWVVDRSRSRISAWYATRFSAYCSWPRLAHTSARPAKQAKVTLR